MANRMINTRIWDDDYVSNLDPTEKLLFLYLLTNSSANLSGIYEVPLKNIASDTGVDKEMVQKVLGRFKKDKKVLYVNGWVCLKNAIKYQNTRNSNICAGIKREILDLPTDIRESSMTYGCLIYEELHLTKLNLTKLNLTTPNGEPEEKMEEAKEVSMTNMAIDLFKEINPSYSKFFGNKTQRKAIDDLLILHGFEKLKTAVSVIAQIRGEPYTPSITTPIQLHEKWAQLENALLRIKKAKPSGLKNVIL